MSTGPHPGPSPSAHGGQRHRLGLPAWAIVALAALSVPRVFAHDLGLDRGPLPALLTLGPAVVWVAVVLWARVPSPVMTLLVVGAIYGVALGVVHNLLWDEVFGPTGPELGTLDADTAEPFLRVATLISSIFTGVMVGVVSGLVAGGLRSLGRRRRPGPAEEGGRDARRAG
jgi:hypothetical protein